MPVDNNGYWKSEDEDATESTQTSDEFAREGGGRQLSIPGTRGENKKLALGLTGLGLENIKKQTVWGEIMEPAVQQS